MKQDKMISAPSDLSLGKISDRPIEPDISKEPSQEEVDGDPMFSTDLCVSHPCKIIMLGVLILVNVTIVAQMESLLEFQEFKREDFIDRTQPYYRNWEQQVESRRAMGVTSPEAETLDFIIGIFSNSISDDLLSKQSLLQIQALESRIL